MRILNAVHTICMRFELADLLRDGLSHAIDADHAIRIAGREEYA